MHNWDKYKINVHFKQKHVKTLYSFDSFLSVTLMDFCIFLFLQRWRPSRPPLTSRRKRTWGSCRSSTIRTCCLRCPASWSQKTCEGTEPTYKPYLHDLSFPRRTTLHRRRSTQLCCQSSQAPPPHQETHSWKRCESWFEWICVYVLSITTRKGLDFSCMLYFAVLNWRETCLHCHQLNWTKRN